MNHTDTPPLKIRPALACAMSTAFRVFPSVFLFELIYKALVNLVIRPLIRLVFQLMLNISGRELILNEDIRSFFLSPFGIIGGIIAVCIAAIVIYFEFAVIIHLAAMAYHKEKPKISIALKKALISAKALLHFDFIGFSVYAMVLLPFVHIGIGSSLIPNLEIPKFVSGELAKTFSGSLLVIGVALIAFILVILLAFVLPAMVLGEKHFLSSVKTSITLSKGRRFKMVLIFLVFIALWGLTLLPVIAAIVGYSVFFDGSMTVAPMLLFLVILLLTTLLQLALTPVLLSVIVTLYLLLDGEAIPENDVLADYDAFCQKLKKRFFPRYAADPTRREPFLLKHIRGIGTFVLVLALGLGVIHWGFLDFNSPLTQTEKYAIGHRGSTMGVENTTQAIQGAFDAGADYAEIDILLSKDSVPMVIHDTNLKRLANQNLNVYDLTAEELKQIPLYDDDAEGRLQTLTEVLEFCKDKQKLLIEFKEHGHETESVVEVVFDTVEKADFQDQAIYHTMVFDCVREANVIRPQYDLGYIIYGTFGHIDVTTLRTLGTDFIVVEEGMFSEELAYQAGQASIPVFVWTPDDQEDMEEYYFSGAKAVITDYPERAVSAKKSVDTESDNAFDSLFSHRFNERRSISGQR